MRKPAGSRSQQSSFSARPRVVPTAVAGKGAAAASGRTKNAPAVAMDNTWGWGAWGPGYAGTRAQNAINVMNYVYVGCASSMLP